MASPDLPLRTIPEFEFLGAIADRLDVTNHLLADIRDRLPAPPAAQPEPESPAAIAISEPAATTPPDPTRPARAGNRRTKGRA